MMKYYVNNGSLHSSEIPLVDENFVEISEEEYGERLSTAVDGREIGTISKNPSGDFISDWGEVIEADYIKALESLGVNFDE